MRAIILGAGRGSRLGGAGGGVPKCLLHMGDRTLLEWQAAALRAAGIDDITVVAGYRVDEVRRVCGPDIRCVDNPRFAQTNSLYSLWLARPLLLDGFVVLNGDVLVHPQLIEDLATARHDDALLVSYLDEGSELGPEEMKVRVRRGRVKDISKEMMPARADAENVGAAKFGRIGARLLVACMDRLVADGGSNDWAPRGFQHFARSRALHAVGTRGYPWIEIDFAEDYERARREVLPAISEGLDEFREIRVSVRVSNAEGAHPGVVEVLPSPVVQAEASE